MTSSLSKTQIAMMVGLFGVITLSIIIGVVLNRARQKNRTKPEQTATQSHRQKHESPNKRVRPRFKSKFKHTSIDVTTPEPTPKDQTKDNSQPGTSDVKQPHIETTLTTPKAPKVYTNKDNAPPNGPFEYKDPTNKKILGPTAWMAQPSEVERKSIDKSLDNSPAKAEQEKNQRRATAYKQANQLAKQAQTQCLQKWPLKPTTQPRRALLSMALEQRPKFGRVRKAIVLSELNIDSEDHLTCLTDTLYNARTNVNIPMWITLKIPLMY